MYTLDKTGYRRKLLEFYKQILDSEKIYKTAEISLQKEPIKNIIYLGVGGSAIVGKFLYDILFDELTVPLDIVRSYFVPDYCNENSLVIASSYSGNTEETVSSLLQAVEKGAQIVTVSSGGRLQQMAGEHGWSHFNLPAGFQPRQALGYLLFPVYLMLADLALLRHEKEDLAALAQFAREAAVRNDYPNASGPVLSRELAHTIQNKIPVIYSTSPYLKTMSVFWQNQIQQNSKKLCFANVLPEMNHNEIVAWEDDPVLVKNFIVIFLENTSVHPRIRKRIELSKGIIKKRGVEVVDIYTSGATTVEKVLSLLILGDWVSFYLALVKQKDPIKIDHINYLKKEMALLED